MSAKQAISDKLQGSVATYLRCGWVVNNQIKKGLLLSLWVKKFKPVNIWQSYKQERDCLMHLCALPTHCYKKLSYRRVTARCVLSVVILPIATQQCRNYLYDKSWRNWWYEVGGLVGSNVSWTMCTQPCCDRVGSHCLRCHKQTDDGRIVYITCIPTTCCGEIF